MFPYLNTIISFQRDAGKKKLTILNGAEVEQDLNEAITADEESFITALKSSGGID